MHNTAYYSSRCCSNTTDGPATVPLGLARATTKSNNRSTLHSNDDDHDNNGSIINLFDRLEPTQVRTGPGNESITTDWYDPHHLGFFADSDQEWTQDRDMWILYDHWAVLKGIVTGTIDLPSISNINT